MWLLIYQHDKNALMYLCKVKIYSIQIQVFCNLKKIELSISWALAPKKINYIYQFFFSHRQLYLWPLSGTIEVPRPGQHNLHVFILVGRGEGRLKNLIKVINLTTFESQQHLGCLSHDPNLMTSNWLPRVFCGSVW